MCLLSRIPVNVVMQGSLFLSGQGLGNRSHLGCTHRLQQQVKTATANLIQRSKTNQTCYLRSVAHAGSEHKHEAFGAAFGSGE